MTAEQARQIRDDVEASHRALDALKHRLTLVIEEAEGRGDSNEARWCRAWFAGDYRECERLLRERYGRPASPAVGDAAKGDAP